MKIKLPFGLNENNILVHVPNVDNGKKCGFICPSCRVALIAVKGNRGCIHQNEVGGWDYRKV